MQIIPDMTNESSEKQIVMKEDSRKICFFNLLIHNIAPAAKKLSTQQP